MADDREREAAERLRQQREAEERRRREQAADEALEKKHRDQRPEPWQTTDWDKPSPKPTKK